MMSSATVTRLDQLIADIREAVLAGGSAASVAHRVADRLPAHLGQPDLLEPSQREPDPNAYRQHVLHVEPDGSFSIVALIWLPGQVTPIHDHVSWCVVGVHQGQEYETIYQRRESDPPLLIATGTSVNPTGSVAALTPPGDIHRVANACEDVAISLHIYGADIGKLGSSIRRRYDLTVADQ